MLLSIYSKQDNSKLISLKSNLDHESPSRGQDGCSAWEKAWHAHGWYVSFTPLLWVAVCISRSLAIKIVLQDACQSLAFTTVGWQRRLSPSKQSYTNRKPQQISHRRVKRHKPVRLCWFKNFSFWKIKLPEGWLETILHLGKSSEKIISSLGFLFLVLFPLLLVGSKELSFQVTGPGIFTLERWCPGGFLAMDSAFVPD